MSVERAALTSAERAAPTSAEQTEPLGVESGLEALRSSSEFHGPVEPLDGIDGLEANEHLALFYESRADQFAAVIPFIRQGLERGERVIYVVDESADGEAVSPSGASDKSSFEAAILEALRDSGVDVEAATESGALTFHSLEETYLRNGRFDPDEMLDFYAAALEEATAEYPALRVTADTKWILDDETTIEDFMEYESRVNDLFRGEDCIALCHYDRETVPAEILVDVIRTHPHLIYDTTVCHNFYYTPPEEFFTCDEADREVDRMLGTLVDRTKARVELDETIEELDEVIEELEESNDRLKRFAYIASHDLQEPLRMISSYLQLLEGRYVDALDEDAREFIDFAVGGADRMRAMVDGLLAYSRIDMQEPAFDPIDCAVVVDDVLTDLQVQIDEGGATVAVDALPAVVGDAKQLEQVFSNLVSNAIKYSGEAPPRIEIAAEKRGDRCVFSVADNGIGIEPAYVDQIFEIFNRLHSNEEYQGTGIGLALCRKIIAHHGGDIWVDSKPGEGTTFYFTLRAAT